MNNANYQRIPASQVTREARQLFRKNFKEMVVLNIIPILMRIIGMFFLVKMYSAWLGNLGVSLSNPQEASRKLTAISQEMVSNPSSASKYAFSMTPQTSILIFAAGFFFFLICAGIAFSMLDKARDDTYEIRTIRDSFQIFSGKYFFPILFLGILFNVIVEAGLGIYLIPGIWFFLMFGQSFFIYKDVSVRADHVGFRGVFTTFARSANMMRGYKWTLLLICIEFFLWEILNLLTHEILSIILHPYEQATMSVFYKKVAEQKGDLIK
ncbi:DUF975 family protein [Companilactobacillus mishanensis]|uniref:DUF975 family protein n=1 Tax=Companilactobacillus mishanensis TaxID=2486008 RepID=A0A5P0ZI58_9LACO|nr:DUF975 family protein [Companilactobacillus mishanensis]MQS46042.1 DUF975 family protein [Companilactobacillus mishanensis]MQS52776.1 DUF975 family protein [Companilactobacillus mishanensis]MQS89522.1 DUF975 family protein [Companilactobacillus mishanensis]